MLHAIHYLCSFSILAASRSDKAQPLQSAVLTLLIYTINLHLSEINTCFLRVNTFLYIPIPPV